MSKAEAWTELKGKLDAVEHVAEARLIVIRDMPAHGSPARLVYENLQQFLQTFGPPLQASRDELAAYVELIERFDRGGQLNPATAIPTIAALRSAMEQAHRV